MRYAYTYAALITLSLAACGGRSAPGLWWTTVNSNNANHNGNGNGNNNNNNNNVPISCGNGVVDTFEECDDGEYNSDTRPDACRTNCRLARCGDDVIDSWEMCDRQNLSDETCEAMGYDGGTLLCTEWCELDESRCTWCGDGLCGYGETHDSCPQDCRSGCGDGWCSEDEDPWTCPTDCGGVCGDGVCDPGEDAWSCPDDCGYCGDGYCGAWEDAWSCPDDCGYCGDGICGGWEDPWSCPSDCESVCGNGICDPGETVANCPYDCGSVCGDGFCSPGEDQWSCPQDCAGQCGDGICDSWEDEWSCPDDCGWCGDGICGQGESTVNCQQDCGTGVGLSCQSIQMCAYCCYPANNCETSCQGQGSPGGQGEYSQLQACRQTQCPQACANGVSWDCLMCSYQDCPGICHYDAGGGNGCATVMNCTSQCGEIPTGQPTGVCTSDPAIQCWDGCWDQADQVAVVLYDSLMQCLTAHCGSLCRPDSSDPTCQSCLTTHCQYQLNTCMSDY